MSDSGLDYVGVKPCGCLGIWVSSNMPRKDKAKEIAKIVAGGLDLRRMATADVKQMPFRCNLCRPQGTLEYTEARPCP
jgi:hypothetical protein